jgi:hypothetical protein
MPSFDEQRDAHTPVEPCELPDDTQLVYVDDRDRVLEYYRYLDLADGTPEAS